mgnify:FL=1|tara:strand:- start:1064 stop:1489 length:426 start_codon:yes stop_codon:yes gene_type:complete
MQMLTADEYAFLAELATAYRNEHLPVIKQGKGWNPHLGVDALCFQHHADGGMVGALITPCELSLVKVPDQTCLTEPVADSLKLLLPSGIYWLSLDRLPEGHVFYKRVILSDVSDLESMQEAARLAQHMMSRLMQPTEEIST